jgi:CRISPR-associated protein Csm2
MNQGGRRDLGRTIQGGGAKGSVEQSTRIDARAEMKKWGIDLGKELSDLSKVNAEKIVDIAEKAGKYLASKKAGGIDSLKINQIRRFLDEIRKIEAFLKKDKNNFDSDRVILLRPKLAYAAGRVEEVIPLMNILDPAIKSATTSAENFKKLLRLVEGIIAYHRYFGGSN